MLTTESEIFLSLIMKFLDPDKPCWQNGSALEVIHKIMTRPTLLKFICSHFDMNEHSTHVFRDMINGKIYLARFALKYIPPLSLISLSEITQQVYNINILVFVHRFRSFCPKRSTSKHTS